MANKRLLKRTITKACGELFAECVAASLYVGNPPKDNVKALLSSIIMLEADFTCRISHPEPGIKPKDYYQKLIDDFNTQVSEIIDQISNLYE